MRRPSCAGVLRCPVACLAAPARVVVRLCGSGAAERTTRGRVAPNGTPRPGGRLCAALPGRMTGHLATPGPSAGCVRS